MLLLAVALLQVSAPQDSKTSADVVVTAPADPGPLPTTTVPATNAGLKNRILFENAQRIAKCAVRLPVARLKAVIDGTPNSGPQRLAQAWLVRRTITCNADPGLVSQVGRGSTGFGTGAGASPGSTEDDMISSGRGGDNEGLRSISGPSVYDYGAILEAALNTFVPDISLTAQQTSDRKVQARFNAREMPRNDKRQMADYQYFEAAVCMVREQPELATRLVRMDAGSRDEARVRARLINGARVCVGNAKKVYVDATQFRIYVMDSLYRWVLASRDVATLLPDVEVASR